MVALFPAFLFQVRDYVLPGYGLGGCAEELDDLADTGFVVPFATVLHAKSLGACKRIQPLMYLGKGPSKLLHRFITMFLKRWHGLTLPRHVSSIKR